jgi:hypothetical protein
MTKFGLFTGVSQSPKQVVEGDYMEQDGAFVKIFMNRENEHVHPRQVGAFNLDKNQVVREVVETKDGFIA